MSKLSFKDLSTPALGPHRDYEQNLSLSRSFCSRVQKSLLQGMAVKVADSEHLKESLLRISFCPPPEAKLGNYCTPISLHQEKNAVAVQTQSIFASYLAFAKKFWDSQPKMKQMDLLQ